MRGFFVTDKDKKEIKIYNLISFGIFYKLSNIFFHTQSSKKFLCATKLRKDENFFSLLFEH